MEKIKTIHYEKPSESIETNYDRDNGDTFPLSKHLKPVHLKNGIKLDEEKKEEKKEESEEQNKDEILNCFVCGWEFLKGMSFQEKNTHINLCIEGKGEQNKKELISTYAEIEIQETGHQAESAPRLHRAGDHSFLLQRDLRFRVLPDEPLRVGRDRRQHQQPLRRKHRVPQRRRGPHRAGRHPQGGACH